MLMKASNPEFKRYSKEIKLSLGVSLHPPDKRRRDIDNPIKILLDSLQRADVFEDDNQIARLLVEKKDIIPEGKVIVTIEVLT